MGHNQAAPGPLKLVREQLLLLSGVGPPNELLAVGVQPVVELCQVKDALEIKIFPFFRTAGMPSKVRGIRAVCISASTDFAVQVGKNLQDHLLLVFANLSRRLAARETNVLGVHGFVHLQSRDGQNVDIIFMVRLRSGGVGGAQTLPALPNVWIESRTHQTSGN